MANKAKEYNTKEYVYDSVFVGFISNGFIYWHLRRNMKYCFKAKIN
jgi:hypothetical protein